MSKATNPFYIITVDKKQKNKATTYKVRPVVRTFLRRDENNEIYSIDKVISASYTRVDLDEAMDHRVKGDVLVLTLDADKGEVELPNYGDIGEEVDRK